MEINIEALRELRLKHLIPMYIVGGYIRDFFLGKNSKKMDVYVQRNTEKLAKDYAEKINGRVIYYKNRQHIWRILDNENKLIANFYEIGEEDLKTCLSKRDFTINSLAIDVFNIDLISKITIIDYFKGLNDLEGKQIKAITSESFKYNPLRLLKAIRYMSELEFELEENTYKYMKRDSKLLENISDKKYTYEIFKILENKRSYHYIDYMEKEFKMFQIIFPEIIPMKCVGTCKYHVVDVFTHSIHTLKKLEEIIYSENFFEPHIKKIYEDYTREIISASRTKLELIKLASLFHDVGKPESESIDEKGRTRFSGHEITGGRIIVSLSKRLNLSNKESEMMKQIIELHMIPLNVYTKNDMSGKALYQVFKLLESSTLDIFLIALADITATRELLDPKEELNKFKVFTEYLIDNYLTRYLEVQDISTVITGKEIIEELGIASGTQIGELIEETKRAIYYGIIGRDGAEALEYMSKLLR